MQDANSKLIRRLLYLGAFTAFIGAILQACGVAKVDGISLIYLSAAGIFLLIRDVKSFAIGTEEVSVEFREELEQVKEEVAVVKSVATSTQSAIIDGVGKRPLLVASSFPNRAVADTENVSADSAIADPQKGRWGGNRNATTER